MAAAARELPPEQREWFYAAAAWAESGRDYRIPTEVTP